MPGGEVSDSKGRGRHLQLPATGFSTPVSCRSLTRNSSVTEKFSVYGVFNGVGRIFDIVLGTFHGLATSDGSNKGKSGDQ
jgi:hypothetical protein